MAKKSRDDILNALKLASESTNNDPLTQKYFFANSDITISDITRHFPKWSDACIAAGVNYDTSRNKIADDEIISDWGNVTRKLGHIPSLNEYKIHGRYGRNAFNRFGKWVNLPNVFRAHFESGDDKEILALIDKYTLLPIKTISKKKGKVKTNRQFHQRLIDRPIYGDPIDFRGLRHEPVNEQGVVFLFGMVARELGYLVEAVQGGYPDCEAKRQISKGQWQPVKIEFEYESKNFVDHGHDPTGCDVIVCWIDNWDECPGNLEVVALSEVIKKL